MESDLEQLLEECLARMEAGASLAECLADHPEQAAELRPLLEAAQMVGSMKRLGLRPEFRKGARAGLIAHMRANPHTAPTFHWRQSLALRYAASLAVLALAFTTAGTALAQQALPGDALYGWKLTSESVWRSLQYNEFDADYYLAERRLRELHAVQGYPELEAIGLKAYSGVLRQLRTEVVEFPDRVDGLNQLFADHRAQVENLLSGSEAELPNFEELFGAVSLPGSNAPDDEPQRAPADEESNSMFEVPLWVTPLRATKKEDEDVDGRRLGGDTEGFLERAIDKLLGSP